MGEPDATRYTTTQRLATTIVLYGAGDSNQHALTGTGPQPAVYSNSIAGAHNYYEPSQHGDPVKECTCSPAIVTRYQKRLSGPLLDRIDIHVEVPRVEYEKLASETPLESSESIRVRVEGARERQRQRFEGTRLSCNAEMGLGR